jgi:hypothetical protein
VDIATKLQIKPDATVFLVAAPDGFDLSDRTQARTAASAGAVLGFVTRRADVARSRQVLAAAAADRVAWLAYPKGGQLGTDINRDLLSADVAKLGLDTVRQIALDDTWSALRLRPARR